MKHSLLNYALLTLFLTSGCGKPPADSTEDTSIDPQEAAVEAGVSLLGGIADDQANSSFALGKPGDFQAQSSPCQRAVSQSCFSGTRSASFSSCSVGSSGSTLAGSVTLSYSDAVSCSMATTGNSVTRTYDLTLTGPRGGRVERTSSSLADYRGTTYGGGGRLTRNASDFSLQILGKHTELYGPRGRKLYDVSVRTLSDLSLNQLARSGRTLTSGQLEVNHNLAGFTAVMTPSNLQWTASCCHPVGGSMSITYSGSRSGTAVVSFSNTCGSASLSSGSVTQTLSLNYCE